MIYHRARQIKLLFHHIFLWLNQMQKNALYCLDVTHQAQMNLNQNETIKAATQNTYFTKRQNPRRSQDWVGGQNLDFQMGFPFENICGDIVVVSDNMGCVEILQLRKNLCDPISILNHLNQNVIAVGHVCQAIVHQIIPT